MEIPAHPPKDSFKFSIFTSVRTLMNKLWTQKGFHKNSIKNKNKKKSAKVEIYRPRACILGTEPLASVD